MADDFTIRDLQRDEYQTLGQLMVAVYSSLEGFPSPEQQPHYYDLLSNIGDFTAKKDARVLVAVSPDGKLLGGVVYFGDMAQYGSDGSATTLTDASGIRLLAVNPTARDRGIGKALVKACITLARQRGHRRVVLHTTMAMRVAWGLYERLGFRRWEELDFRQEDLAIFGFRLELT